MRRSPVRRLVVVLAAPVLLAAFLVAPAGAAAPAETDVWAASLSVNLAENSVSTAGWIADSAVELTIWADATDLEATPISSEPLQVDASGSVRRQYSGGDDPPDLIPGMGFAVSGLVRMWNPNTAQHEVTPVTKVLTDTWLQITEFDVDGDAISGTGATPGNFQICAGGEWANVTSGCAFTYDPASGLVVDPDGTWHWDTTAVGVDVVSGVMQVQAANEDLNGDRVQSDELAIPWPRLEVSYPQAALAMGFGYTETDVGTDAVLTATRPGQEPQQVVSTVTDGSSMGDPGYLAEFWFDGPLEAGTTLEFSGPRPGLLAGEGDVVRSVVVTPPTIDAVVLDGSWVVGTAAPFADVMVYPWEPGPPGPWVRRHVVADENGWFNVTVAEPGDEGFESDVLTMTPAGSVGVHEYDADYDLTRIGRPNVLPEPMISVLPDQDLADGQMVTVSGWGYPPGQVRFIQCAAPGGSADLCDLGTMSDPVDTWGEPFSAAFVVRRHLSTGTGPVDCGSEPGACIVGAFQGMGEVRSQAAISFRPPLWVGLAVAPVVTVNAASGRATVSGTVTCSTPGEVALAGELWQRQGRKGIAYGYFSTALTCELAGEPVGWSAVLTPGGSPLLPFTKGIGEVTVSAAMDQYDEHVEEWWTGTVTITVPKVPKPPKPSSS